MTIRQPEESSLPALKQLWRQAFGDTEVFIEGFFRDGFSGERCRCVYVDGIPAAALYWFDCSWQGKKLAYLYGVATEERFQGQGLCRALMMNTHSHLRSLGYDGTVLVPGSQALFGMYGKLDYRPFCPMKTTRIKAKLPELSVQPLCPGDYGRLRGEKLPENGIVQEGATLSFLAGFAGFYAAGDALFCLSREGGTLYFQEFLGDPGALPGIIAALGAEDAVVRLPGGSTPFAMYFSLTPDAQLPSYFGIALN